MAKSESVGAAARTGVWCRPGHVLGLQIRSIQGCYNKTVIEHNIK